jgi:PadR family transcriptional regulator, regulatory protein PadR
MAKNDLQETLDPLVLKTLAQSGSLHGYGIVLRIRKASESVLSVEEGSLYPTLHRLEQNRWIASEWARTETGWEAKYYKLTAAGTGGRAMNSRCKRHRTRRLFSTLCLRGRHV